MNEFSLLKISNVSLHQGRTHFCKREYRLAFKCYLYYLASIKSAVDRYQIHKEFIIALNACARDYRKARQFEESMQCFSDALKYFPSDTELLISLARQFAKVNCCQTGLEILQNILTEKADYLPALRELDNIRNKVVDRWHYCMLNDHRRNIAYKNAIFLKIREGYNNVLDIGAGTGILSIFAALNNVKSVTACDYNDIMCKIAQEVIENNSTYNTNKIKVIHEVSTNLRIPELMETKATLLVMEIFDCGFFGEQVLQTVIDAWDRLLETEAAVIPASADLFICGINCLEIARKRTLLKSENMHLRLNQMCLIYETESDPYDSEKLQRKNVTYLTDVGKGMHVDFQDPELLKELYLSNIKSMDIGQVNKDIYLVTLKCTESGELHAFAVWFNLNLCSSISISSSPFNDENDSCWEQSIVYLHHPITLQHGDIVKVRLTCKGGILEATIIEPIPDSCHRCIKVSQDFLYFVNDSLLMQSLSNTAAQLCAEIGFFKKENISVLDAMPFPILGIMLALRAEAKVTFVIRSPDNEDAIRIICNSNGGVEDQVSFVHESDLEEYINLMVEKNAFDYIFLYPITPTGALLEKHVRLYPELKRTLKFGGRILPKQISVCSQLLGCDYLDKVNQVDDENTGGVKIASTINAFRVLEHWDIDVDMKKFELSFCCKFKNILNDQDDEFKCVLDCVLKKTGTVNAILYWFEMQWLNRTTNTLWDNVRNYNYNTCFMLDKPIEIETLNKIPITFRQHKGFIELSASSKLKDG